MNRFFTLLLVMGLAMTTTVMAESISESQARSIAAGFMSQRAMPTSTLQLAKKAPRMNAAAPADKAAYYVFSDTRAQSGFIIIAGDDRAPAVLGYSDRGTFDEATMPDAMRELLDSYAEQIEALDQGETPVLGATRDKAIAPMVPSRWGQGNPYNILTPIINGSHAVAGCVATAMAQVMYYWQWPVCPSMTIPGYSTSTNNIYMPALDPVDFNWSAMQNIYLTNDTLSVAANAVATLMLYCAQSVQMNYKASASSATTSKAPWALSNYFGYKPTIHYLSRLNYSTDEWESIILDELVAKRPVIYSASKASSGHAFVCDGYDGNGLFHINWGWNSQSDGYFLLSVLNPTSQGIGSAAGAYGYIYSQGIIVGMEPGTADAGDPQLTFTQLSLGDCITTRSESSGSFQVTVSGRYCNYWSAPSGFDLGWALYQDSTMLTRLYGSYITTLNPGSYVAVNSRMLSFGGGLTSGTYRIIPIYSIRNAGNWKPCIGSDKNYIEVTINGNYCNVKGYGTAATAAYRINDITLGGTKHPNKPLYITANATNTGQSCNDLIYMFVNGTFTSTAFADINPGDTGDLQFQFTPTEAGTLTLTFSLNEDGSNPFFTRIVTIDPMPEASLTISVKVLNITDATNKIVTSDKFSVEATITNSGTTDYHEDFSARLYRNTYGSTGSSIQTQTVPLDLAVGETKTLQFDFAEVVDGWRYFVWTYYYSAGSSVQAKGTQMYTIIFPEIPEFTPGDVNNDGNIDVTDVTLLIDYLLNPSEIEIDNLGADVNGDENIDITDVTMLIDMILR